MVAALKMAGGTSPEGKLAGLKATRTELLGRVAQLTAARQQLDAAADGERAATAAIGELDAAEIGAASEWASMGAGGAPPAPDNHKRRELAERLASAQAAAAAARGAGANLEGELAGLRAELANIDTDWRLFESFKAFFMKLRFKFSRSKCGALKDPYVG